VLSKYDLERLLSRGRFGSEVYIGTHKAMGHPVAVRVLRRGAHTNFELARERLLREARTLQVSHPSVLQVRDFGEEGDLLFIVTELFEATSLRALLQQEGHLPWPRLMPLAGQLLAAASAIHRRNHLLCGLTPEIILIAKEEDEEQGERLIVSAGGVSQVGDIMAMLSEASLRGTGRPDPELYYLAPELLVGGAPDVRSEVFTLAAIVYEMAAGRRPFDAPTFPTLLGTMMKGQPADPREAQPDLPEHVAVALLQALTSDPAARPPTPGHLGSALFAKAR
jgi:serine/threonine-protein kinase